MSFAHQSTTPADRFDEALAEARRELSCPLPERDAFRQATAKTGAGVEALKGALAARFAYPQIPGRAAQSYRMAQARLRQVERKRIRRLRGIRLRLLWRRIRRAVAWTLAGLLLLAMATASYRYRAEIRDWVRHLIPPPPATPPQAPAPATPPTTPPQAGAGGTRP